MTQMHECKKQIAIKKASWCSKKWKTRQARWKFEHMLNMHNGMYKANKKKRKNTIEKNYYEMINSRTKNLWSMYACIEYTNIVAIHYHLID